MTETPPSGTGPGDESTGASAIDVKSMIEDWRKYGHELVDRVADRADENAELARKGQYNRDRWLDDIELFWKNFADDARRGVDYARDNLPPQDNADRK